MTYGFSSPGGSAELSIVSGSPQHLTPVPPPGAMVFRTSENVATNHKNVKVPGEKTRRIDSIQYIGPISEMGLNSHDAVDVIYASVHSSLTDLQRTFLVYGAYMRLTHSYESSERTFSSTGGMAYRLNLNVPSGVAPALLPREHLLLLIRTLSQTELRKRHKEIRKSLTTCDRNEK